MSGGSFDYACFVANGEDAMLKAGNLRRLRGALATFPDAERAVLATDALLARCDHLDAWFASGIADALRDVWQAVEWERSGDYGALQVRDALRRFDSLANAVEQSAALTHARVAVQRLTGDATQWPALVALVAAAVQGALDEDRMTR